LIPLPDLQPLKKPKMKIKLILALVASLTNNAFAEFKAPLPEFKNEKQLAEWRAGKASEATSQGYAAEETAFYTGKPYLTSAGGYAFKYRNYKPEIARWTSEDPSGFPDGANGSIYVPSPINTLDPSGLSGVRVTGVPVSGSTGSSLSIQIDDPPKSIGAQGIAQGEFIVSWIVDSSLSGWVVQKVTFDYSGVYLRDGGQYESNPRDPYWEAWRVDAGVVSGLLGPDPTDTFRTDPFLISANRGFAEIRGVVDFYRDSAIGSSNNPSTWDGHPLSGLLPTTTSLPSWWTGSGFNHSITVSWE
jgi:RHS repeat-associated protein